jgi:hypothetical protein
MKRPKRPRDPAQLAKLMIDIASGEVEDSTPTAKQVRAGKGGSKGGPSACADTRPAVRNSQSGGGSPLEKVALTRAVQASRDLHFFNIFLEIERRLQRFLFGMHGVVVVHFHCQRETVVGDLAPLVLDTLFNVASRSYIDIRPLEER